MTGSTALLAQLSAAQAEIGVLKRERDELEKSLKIAVGQISKLSLTPLGCFFP